MKAFPRCFETQARYDEYKECAGVFYVIPPYLGKILDYCQDCLPDYKAKCINLGLCQHPETFFKIRKDKDGDECVVGVSYHTMYAKKYHPLVPMKETLQKAVAAHKRRKAAAIMAKTLVV